MRIIQESQKVPDGHLSPTDEPQESPMHSLFSQNNAFILLNSLTCPVTVSRKGSAIYNMNLANMRQVQYKQFIKINEDSRAVQRSPDITADVPKAMYQDCFLGKARGFSG